MSHLAQNQLKINKDINVKPNTMRLLKKTLQNISIKKQLMKKEPMNLEEARKGM